MARGFLVLNLLVGLLLGLLYYEHGPQTAAKSTELVDGVEAAAYEPGAAKPTRAAFVVLVRNSDLRGMKQAMRQIEDRFNRRFNYPYVFLNDVPFTDEFMVETRAMTRANVSFGTIPHEHWSYPAWINQTYAQECRQRMHEQKVFYALSESYRHMCRFYSGFFFRHPLLQDLDYYWRIEPDVEYTCDINYDPFLFMQRRGIKYGYTIALHEYPETIPTLWTTVKNHIAKHPEFVRHPAGMRWLSATDGDTYNGCHFWSNFEIGSLELFRSPEYQAYFEHLDRAGGFFYERWGDAPVHAIAAALMLQKHEVHWFQDIGYYHNPWHNCPQDAQSRLRCHCDPAKNAASHYWASCTHEWLDLPNANTTGSRGMLRRGFTDLEDLSDTVDMPFEKSTYINDPIHGYIRLNKDMLQIIDTPQFQRLRSLKQLGTSYFVFPGGSHNRFEHCIGTAFLAGEVIEGLAQRQPELEISARDIRCVTLAGLCHDLGHGPFSHIFDNKFIPQAMPGSKWSHEMGSEMMLDHLIDDNHIDTLDSSDVSFIKQLIRGCAPHSSDGKMFLFDIVANKRNGVDVDRFDYVQRDCYNVGVRTSYDFSRLMLNSRVIGDEICYNQKEAFNLTEMFHTRYSLHKRVYSHRAGKAFELMMVDIMLIADPVLRISEAITDPRRYQLLTDNIVHDIERSSEPELQPARDLITRIYRRDTYKFVDEYLLPPDQASAISSAVTAAAIVGFRTDNDDFVERDVLINIGRINYGKGRENPIDHVRFYSNYAPNEKYAIDREMISLCVPEKYEERILRIYTRSSDKRGQIQRAARRLVNKLNRDLPATPNSSPPSMTPNRGLTIPDNRTVADSKRRRLLF
ncbi:hypothetical protein LPJ78_004142 [Coemansia sp. RSA 989]|nr:hypothetical protein LPJ78_004142 [Coemansia sp. RSA 989]